MPYKYEHSAKFSDKIISTELLELFIFGHFNFRAKLLLKGIFHNKIFNKLKNTDNQQLTIEAFNIFFLLKCTIH